MGSGRSGLYNGASIPVTKPEGVLCIKVRFNKKKTEGYLLNQDHPTGGSKAKFMREVLGTKNMVQLMSLSLCRGITDGRPIKS